MASPVAEEIKKAIQKQIANAELERRKSGSVSGGTTKQEFDDATRRQDQKHMLVDSNGQRRKGSVDEQFAMRKGGMRMIEGNPKTQEEYEREQEEFENEEPLPAEEIPPNPGAMSYKERVRGILSEQEHLRKMMRNTFMDQPVVTSLVAKLEKYGFENDDYYYILVHFLGIMETRSNAQIEMILDLLNASEQINVTLIEECDDLISQITEIGLVANELQKLQHTVSRVERLVAQNEVVLPKVVKDVQESADALRERNIISIIANYGSYAIAMGIGTMLGMGATWDFSPMAAGIGVAIGMTVVGVTVGLFIGQRGGNKRNEER